MKHALPLLAALGLILAETACAEGERTTLENDQFAVVLNPSNGTITSLRIKRTDCELIGEPRLAANFRLLLPLPDYQCHYIEGERQEVASIESSPTRADIRFSGLKSERGTFPLELACAIELVDDTIRFRSRLVNHSDYAVAELWYPRIGGWTQFGPDRSAALATPNYTGCGHGAQVFRYFPGGRGLGAEAAEFASNYPGMVMPWWDLYHRASDYGLYMGYHDTTFRLSTWHMYLYPNTSGTPGDSWLSTEQAAGAPVGIVFSHVRYPYLQRDETLDSGEFLLRLHRGDWHTASKDYRAWFLEHFPFDKSGSWLRKKSAWFTSIIYQPEDRIIADYETYDQWCRDAEACGIHCFELIGWDHGGLERAYPEYEPEDKLGGLDGFRRLLQSIDARGSKCLVFANYNVLDCNTDWYRLELHRFTHQDTFGNTPNWMGWGESTLTARIALSVRRHVLASVVPEFEAILEEQFVELVRHGAHGLQLDKVVAGSALDFNPLNTMKPDTALCEGLVQAIGRVYEKCRAVDPEFCLASEASQDRLIPYVDVFYRNSGGFDIAPLRYVFPEWTSCQHLAAPCDFNGVNAAAVTGSVICVEPDSYQGTLAEPAYKTLGEYIREVERIRNELAETIFLGTYYDTMYGHVHEVTISPDETLPKYRPAHTGALPYRVHGHRDTDRRAIVVANTGTDERTYFWEFSKGRVDTAELYAPFEPVRTVHRNEPVAIPGQRFHVIIEQRQPHPDDLALLVQCGAPDEIALANPGYDVAFEQCFQSAWGPKWVPPVYHCRAHEQEVRIALTVPAGVSGTLRLYVIDPDEFYGGRQQEIRIDGTSLGTIEGFVAGQWIEHPLSAEITQDGTVLLQVVNLKKMGNCVVSIIEFLEHS
ncbi:MAG TPA: DUF6259 domain-containing protein [Candidatus Hydrogenedentes bacterium]|nr:DUF6259 domain-containing protein [Candidatus Hydrogenedentota bacterium]HPG67615.1 DUF6259 domain-containing protein [Candidatus Hydrogenedentota bacterium]